MLRIPAFMPPSAPSKARSTPMPNTTRDAQNSTEQVIPANILFGLSYGKRAREAIDEALELDPKSSKAYLARGVGNYYLPDALGGGPSVALPDFYKAIELEPEIRRGILMGGAGRAQGSSQ